MNPITIDLHVNGEQIQASVPARMHLIDFLRERLELTGSHVGCEHGVCGACTVRVNGDAVRGCLVLAASLDGADVWTVEGLTATGELKPLQDAFHARNALQCGYCTPGMLVAAAELLRDTPTPSRAEIRDYMSGNYCRCTGYHAIVDAIETASQTKDAIETASHAMADR